MAWSTVLRYKRGDLEPLAVGRELAVQSVLVGRILPPEQTVTMSLELVDVATGAHMWGEEYSRGWNDIQTLPGEIARELAARLKRGDGREEKLGRAERYTQNPEAYADYLHGRHHWHRLTPDALPRSVVYFESAIAKDPEFGLAHAGEQGADLPLPSGGGVDITAQQVDLCAGLVRGGRAIPAEIRHH